MPSVFVISLLKIKPYLVTENIFSVDGICHQRHVFFLGETGYFSGVWCPGRTRRLNREIDFWRYVRCLLESSSSFVNVKVCGKMKSSRLL